MSAHLVLIDALNLIRRIYAVQERPFVQSKSQLDGELATKTQTQVLFNTQQACTKALSNILSYLQASHALVVFDSQQPCWRYQLYADYKKGRKKMSSHLANKLPAIQDAFMALGVDSLLSEEDEADDLREGAEDLQEDLQEGAEDLRENVEEGIEEGRGALEGLRGE